MGACKSKGKTRHETDLDPGFKPIENKSHPINGNVDKSSALHESEGFANVPFIDSDEKSPKIVRPTSNDDENPTTIKTAFENNVQYSNEETVRRLKEEIFKFLREKVFPSETEKEKLVSFVEKRIVAKETEKQLVMNKFNEFLEQIEKNEIDKSDDPVRNRFFQQITVFVGSKSTENSFLAALYQKLGNSLDLNALNAESTENERVEITVTKTVRKVFLDESKNESFDEKSNGERTVIQIPSSDPKIPNDLPEDLRRKAEQVLTDFNELFHQKSS